MPPTVPILVASAALASMLCGCVIDERPVYRQPGTVVVPANQTIEEHNTIHETTHIKSTTHSTTNSTTNIQTNHPEATVPGQQVDPTVQKFDKDGNPNFDEDGNYIGGHGIGTMVDNPDAPQETGSNPEPEATPDPVPDPTPDPVMAPDPEPTPEPMADPTPDMEMGGGSDDGF